MVFAEPSAVLLINNQNIQRRGKITFRFSINGLAIQIARFCAVRARGQVSSGKPNPIKAIANKVFSFIAGARMFRGLPVNVRFGPEAELKAHRMVLYLRPPMVHYKAKGWEPMP
jgi:hypothetical protein